MPDQAAPGSCDGIEPMLRWYLVHTKPSRESIAETNLRRQGYVVYVPRMIDSMRRGGRSNDCLVPLFPRYLFLQLSEGYQPLNPVRSSIGVAGIVRFGMRYAIVPERIVTELQSRADPESGLHRLASRNVLTPGTSVRITTGPFEGLNGVFERQAGEARVIVLLRLLGQEAPVRLAADFVIHAHAA